MRFFRYLRPAAPAPFRPLDGNRVVLPKLLAVMGLVCAAAGCLLAQAVPPGAQAPPPAQTTPPAQARPAQTPPAPTPAPAQPAPPAQTRPAQAAPPAQTPQGQTTPPAQATSPAQTVNVQTTPPPQTAAPAAIPAAPASPRLAESRGFLLGGASLTEMIDVLAKMLKINYILDPRVKGSVTIYTYGEVKEVDLMPLLETILRVNGATMVKVGDLYRIVPVGSVSQLPLDPAMNADPKSLPEDERMVLNLIFLKYATAPEMDKLLAPFYGEGASHSVYEPANLLIIEDNSRNMKRTMELISMFDSDTFAGQRVKLFGIQNSRPSDLQKDLDSVFKAYALSDKAAAVRFLPVDRINTLIAVAPNPGIFEEVQKWIEKLDIPVKLTAGSVSNYVYRLKYGNAMTVAMAIMALYSGNPFAMMSLASSMNMGMGGYGGGGMMGGYGMGGGGMGMGGYGMGGYGAGGMGMGAYGAAMGMGGYGMGGYGMGGYGMGGYGYGMGAYPQTAATGAQTTTAAGTTGGSGLTGQYLGGGAAAAPPVERIPHVIPNPFDNTLLVQGTPQEWEQIRSLLRQLDIAPRQVLIDAKIYELDLSGAFASGVEAFLEKANSGGAGFGRALNLVSSGGLTATGGALVLRSSELMAAVSLAESQNKSKVISSPSIIATDSIPAVMNVGQSVPVLTSSGVAVTGSSFNSIGSQSTGTTLSIMARINSSGVITMVIDQDVSEPQATTTSSISSPTFQNRHFSTQVTVQDGDTIAIGGFIQDSKTDATQGIPFLDRLPGLGYLFGSKSHSTARTELVVFLTPRIIWDTTQIQDATDEIKNGLSHLQKDMKGIQ